MQQHHQNTQANADEDESDDGIKPCSKRYSKTLKNANSPSPMQVGFYLPKWKDFLEECKVEVCSYAAIHDPWPCRREMLNGFILDTINMIVSKWLREGRTIEKGYYPKYKNDMGELVCCTPMFYMGTTNYF